jgi:hypothetical protein
MKTASGRTNPTPHPSRAWRAKVKGQNPSPTRSYAFIVNNVSVPLAASWPLITVRVYSRPSLSCAPLPDGLGTHHRCDRRLRLAGGSEVAAIVRRHFNEKPRHRVQKRVIQRPFWGVAARAGPPNCATRALPEYRFLKRCMPFRGPAWHPALGPAPRTCNGHVWSCRTTGHRGSDRPCWRY